MDPASSPALLFTATLFFVNNKVNILWEKFYVLVIFMNWMAPPHMSSGNSLLTSRTLFFFFYLDMVQLNKQGQDRNRITGYQHMTIGILLANVNFFNLKILLG